jgi:formamidopyrimidine-DNA glycosylase
MPELPEIEAFARAQRERLTAEPIESVPVAHFATVKTIDPPVKSLAGQRFTDVTRRAKRLLLPASGGHTLVIHPMSAGRINVADKHGKSALLVVRFASGLELVLSEPGSKRRAAAWLWSPAELEAELAHTGPEPLDPAFTPAVLREAMQRRPGQLHAFLRDQRNVAGIGRGYADEILHEAKLSPFARTATLSDDDVERLHAAIVRQLSDATERMVPLSGKGLAGHANRGYTVHDHAGELCPVCGDTIRTVSFEEHTVHYCPTCQTGGRILADRRMSKLLR